MATPMQIATAVAVPIQTWRQRVLPALLAQEGGDDPDDQGRFEAFPQSDHERGQHQ